MFWSWAIPYTVLLLRSCVSLADSNSEKAWSTWKSFVSAVQPLIFFFFFFVHVHVVRVLSLRSSVIHGFVTEPWYSHHVRVFMWARGFECARVARSLVCVPCFMLERGVWIPALMSWVLVTWRGSDTRAPFSVIVWVRGLEFARHRALLSTCVLLCCTQFVFLSAACSYVICCAVWHTACIFIGCVLSCCLVWTRGLWVFSLAACSCPVLHMAGDLFAGHVLVFLFYVSTWLLS